MDQNFFYMYKQLADREAREVFDPEKLISVPEFIAGLMDHRHVVVLNVLLENLKNESRDLSEAGGSEIKPAKHTYEMVQAEFEKLSEDLRLRLDDFCLNWKNRFSRMTLFSYLESNGWIINQDGKYRLAGRGTRQESRNLYQQSSLQDMVAEGVRIVALFEGMMLRQQEKIALKWHQEAVMEDASKLLPLLESTLRTREMDLIKGIRISLPEIFSDLFTRKVSRWDTRIYQTPEALFRHIVWPWYNPERHANGFEGFTLYFVNFVWEITSVTFDLYRRKWRLFLRGLQKEQSRVSSVLQ